MKQAKYILVVDGVLSFLGKGIAAASIATLLKNSKLKVSILKAGPYINVNPGTTSPFEHSEVFVTEDGAETDLDLGHYERFLDENLNQDNNFTTGKVYQSVIEKERRGEYLGKTIQVTPHIAGEIKEHIIKTGENRDILIVKIGGTVGDIEGLPFLEATRALKLEVGKNSAMNIHLTLVPFIKAVGELKTKPTQHSVGELRRMGISPDMITCRSEKPLGRDLKDKIAISCGVERNCIIESMDAASIYQIPLNFLKQDILTLICQALNLKNLKPNMENRDSLAKRVIAPSSEVKIVFVGKYVDLKESYKSLTEALIHAGTALDTRAEIRWTDSEKPENLDLDESFKEASGVLVAGGFDVRGVEDKIKAITYAREHRIPPLGICLGMQLVLVEFARNILKIKDANSSEFEPNCKNAVVHLIDEFIDSSDKKQVRITKTPLGGTMRLGVYPCQVKENTLLSKIYNAKSIKERHRYRYEASPELRKDYENKDLVVSGESDGLIEAVELKTYDFFPAVQFHPEFISRLERVDPVILSLIKAVNAYHS